MTHEALTERVVELLREVREPDVEPTVDSRILEDLGFDSLSVLELVAAVEDELEITVPLNDLPRLLTVGQIVDYVEQLVAS